jgi:TRAP-type C4-dicarboxylate transport system permease large subunit
MNDTTTACLLVAAMVAAFGAAMRAGRLSDALAILVSAVVGIVLAGFGPLDSLRHLVDGSFTFLPIVLIIFAAQIFINIQKASGALNATVRDLVARFHTRPRLLLVLLMFLVILPGALTGPGAAGQFAFGSVVSSLLLLMGIPRVKVASFIAMGGTIGIFAPPVNIPAMIIAAGVNMPYIGFFWPLLIVTVPLAVYAALHLGLRHIRGPLDRDAALATLPAVPAHMTAARVYLPLVVVVALMLLVRAFPHVIPPLGIPLMFLAGGAVAFLAGGARINLIQVARDTFRETLEVNAILITVGSLVQVMAANGVRGLVVLSSISVPVYVLYAAIFVVCVFLGGVLGPFAVASVFGIPFMLALLGRDPIMATVALSLLACVSSVTPPTAILGKSAMILADCRDSYASFLRVSAVPTLAIAVAGIAGVVYANALGVLRFSW